MAKTYKVWLEIEEYDEESGEGRESPGLEFPATAIFETLAEAEAFAERLHRIGAGEAPA